MAITKIQASILYGYGYILIDKEGAIYRIDSLNDFAMTLEPKNPRFRDRHCSFKDIGTDYFILARPLEQLIQQIEHEGHTFTPMKKLKTGGTNSNTYSKSSDGYAIYDNEQHELKYDFIYGFQRMYRGELRSLNQDELNTRIRQWHFNVGFPDGSVKPLK